MIAFARQLLTPSGITKDKAIKEYLHNIGLELMDCLSGNTTYNSHETDICVLGTK